MLMLGLEVVHWLTWFLDPSSVLPQWQCACLGWFVHLQGKLP